MRIHLGKFNGYEKEDIIGIYDEVNNQKISLKKITLIKEVENNYDIIPTCANKFDSFRLLGG